MSSSWGHCCNPFKKHLHSKKKNGARLISKNLIIKWGLKRGLYACTECRLRLSDEDPPVENENQVNNEQLVDVEEHATTSGMMTSPASQYFIAYV